jgi:hypothetical protein
MRCNVCHAEMGPPIFDADSDRALTSLCELRETRTRVWACAACGHLRGEALPDTKEYYESQYRILLDQDEEDQIYTVQGDEIVYRTEHQVRTLLGKLQLKESALFLDYGCAKASTPMRLLRWRLMSATCTGTTGDMSRPKSAAQSTAPQPIGTVGSTWSPRSSH